MKRFHVYYNAVTGIIRSISPVITDEHPDCAVTQIDYTTALNFLTGVWDSTSWFVNSNSSETNGVLTQSQFDLLPAGSGGLESIPRENSLYTINSAIVVTVYTKSNTFEVTIPTIRPVLDFANIPSENMVFILTKRNDPSYVIAEITVPIKELFDTGVFRYQFKSTLLDFSVYTEKVFRFYQLKIKKNATTRSTNNGRINKLVEFRKIKKIKDASSGIIVVHNINKHVLEISLVDIEYEPDAYTTGQLYLTKKNDPTILIDIITFAWADLYSNKSIVVPILPIIGKSFGIASFPYTDELSFMRT